MRYYNNNEYDSDNIPEFKIGDNVYIKKDIPEKDKYLHITSYDEFYSDYKNTSLTIYEQEFNYDEWWSVIDKQHNIWIENKFLTKQNQNQPSYKPRKLIKEYSEFILNYKK